MVLPFILLLLAKEAQLATLLFMVLPLPTEVKLLLQVLWIDALPNLAFLSLLKSLAHSSILPTMAKLW